MERTLFGTGRGMISMGRSANMAEMEAHLELKSDNIRLRDVEQLDHLACDVVDVLHVLLRARPELYLVHVAPQADDRAVDLSHSSRSTIVSHDRRRSSSCGLFFV